MKISRTHIIQSVLVVFVVLLLFTYDFFSEKHGPIKINAMVKEIISDCTKIPGDHAPCYETEVPSLYPTYSVQDLFTIVRDIRAADPTYQFCHVLAHKIGERVVAEDPTKWIEAIPFNPSDGLCSNGFIHGVTVGRFHSEVLTNATLEKNIPDFARACEPREGWAPSGLDQAICYHGMGHLFDFVTDADIPKGLSLCERISQSPTGNFRRVCIEGVFMQIYQPLEPDDFELIARMKSKPTKDTARSYCAQFTNPEYEGACLRESWPFFRDAILQGKGATAFCSGQPNDEETEKCYDSVSSIIGRMSLADPSQAAGACNALLPQWQLKCYTASAQATLEEDRNTATKAFALCARGSGSIPTQCAATIIDRAVFVFGKNTNEYAAFCRAAPKELQGRCNIQN